MRGGSSVAVAMSAANIATYAFTMIAARIIGPVEYGSFVAGLNLLIIIQVVSLGIQATAARRISEDPAHVAQIEHTTLAVTLRGSLLVGGLLLVLSPLVDLALQLDSLATAVVIALASVPLTLTGGQAGILQGERRWVALSLLYLMGGVPRLLVGLALIAWQPHALAALVGVAIGYVGPVVVGWLALRERRRPDEVHPTHRAMAMVREGVHNSQALFAYFALSSVDIIVARHVLTDHDSGLYAAGLIMTKAMLFLPQFVVVVAYPAMAAAEERRRALTRSLAVVTLLGAGGVLSGWLFSDLAMIFVGGSAFAEIEPRLWVFALLGTVLSMVQLLVYAVLARQGRRCWRW
jgi:O-antigen/teichoic acid export membrane protein